MRRISLVAAAVAIALSFAIPAQAHVTLNPRSVAAESFARLDARVPNERDTASTKKISVRFPEGFPSVSWKPVWGWTAKVSKVKLATPIKTDEGEITERVSKITWTATAKRYRIVPGSFEEFGLSTRIPNTPGKALSFPALQTYSNGEVVRWTGAPGSDTPAAVVNVVAPTT
jgi:periplasmic copper chaperone A